MICRACRGYYGLVRSECQSSVCVCYLELMQLLLQLLLINHLKHYIYNITFSLQRPVS
jgi:hypothetical protein